MGDAYRERDSDSTCANADCRNKNNNSYANETSTSNPHSSTNTKKTHTSRRTTSCFLTDMSSNSSTRGGNLNASNGKSGNTVCKGIGSTRSPTNVNHTESSNLQRGNYVDAWETSSCTFDKTASCAPRKVCTAAAGRAVPDTDVKDVGPEQAVLTAGSATIKPDTRSCSGHASEGATPLWNAFFADEATDLGLLLLMELQRELRAQHLQEASLLGCPHATASSLPLWLNLCRVLHTAAAAAAAVAAVSSPPTAPRQSAEDISILQRSLPALPPAAVSPAIALAPPTADVSAGDDGTSQWGERAWASDSAAAAPPAAGALLCVDKRTLQTVLQLLPVLAFKESEQLLRWGERAGGAGNMKCMEAACYKQPRQLLGAGTCDALVCRLKQMLIWWRRLVASLMRTHSHSGNICSTKTSGSTGSSYRSNKSCPGAFCVGTLRDDGTSNGSSGSACCCSASASDVVYRSSGCSTCTSNTQGSRVFVTGAECFSLCLGGPRCKNSADQFFGFVGKSFQHLLLQFLHSHALVTAVVWGRQAHLHEQRCFRRETGHAQTRLPSAHAPRQQQQTQTQQKNEKEKSQELHEFRYPQQHVSRVSRAEVLMAKAQSSHQDLRWQWQRERRWKQERQQQQGQHMQQGLYQDSSERHSLQVCLQRLLLLLLQRPRVAADESTGNAPLVRDTPKEAQRQRQLIFLCMLQLLSFCSADGDVRQDTHADTAAADYAVESGITLEQPQDRENTEQRQQLQWCRQQYLQQSLEQHVPVRPRCARPATTRTAGVRERHQLASASASHGRCDTSNTDSVSTKLTMQLLLCDSQLYIHVSSPIACPASESERPDRCQSCSSVSLQTPAAQQVAGEWHGGPVIASVRQLERTPGDQSAALREAASRDLSRAGAAAASFREATASIPAAQEATHALPGGEIRVRGGMTAVKRAAGKLSSKGSTTDATQDAEPMADVRERLLPGGCEPGSTAITAAATVNAAADLEGSNIKHVRVDHTVCRSHRSRPLVTLAAGTASESCTDPCVLCRSSCDFEAAVGHWCRISADDNHTLPALRPEALLAVAKAPYGQVSRQAGTAEKSLSECGATSGRLKNAAGGGSLSPRHCCSDEIRKRCSACLSVMTTPSTQLSTTCRAPGEERHYRPLWFGSSFQACCDHRRARSTATDLVATPIVGASQHTLPVAAPDGRQRQNNDSRCFLGYERIAGRPQELELSFRPAVLRVSLLHTRGSFRSFFRTCTHTSVVPAATTIAAQDPQQQVEPRRPVSQDQRHTHHTVGMDLSFRLPDLLQQDKHESQAMRTATEPASSIRRGASRPWSVDKVKSIQRGQAEAAAESTTSTITSGLASVVRGSHREQRLLQDTHETGSASGYEALNSSRSCRQSNSCRPSGQSASHLERERDRDCNSRSTCNSSQTCSNPCGCFVQRAGASEAVEPEDIVVCCFFESGAMTLNGRVVQFFENGRDGECFPCVVDVLLLSWYGADPFSSEPSSPAFLPVPQLCSALGERSSDSPRQYTPSTVSTRSSSSASSGSGALPTLWGSNSSSSSGRGTNNSTSWRTSGSTSAASQESASNRRNSTCSSSPLLVCSCTGQRMDETALTITRDTDAPGRSSYSSGGCVSQPSQPHVCLLFLAANGTLFGSGDVPSVYLPPCVTCGVSCSSCEGCISRGSRVPRSSRSSTPAIVPASLICSKHVADRGGHQCEGAPSLTTARYGTLYDAVYLPAVCAATHRPILFGSFLASNTAAVALTSNLLLPRYRRRVPLHQRQLSFKVLKCDSSISSGSIPGRQMRWAEHPPTVDSLPPVPPTPAMTAFPRSPPPGYDSNGHTAGPDEAGQTFVQWQIAAAAAGSGAAVAVLQAHTGEPVLLQQHRQEAYTAATTAIWRGNAAGLCDTLESSDVPLAYTEPFQRRRSQTSEGTPPMGPAEAAGFSLRFVTLPDLRSLSPLQPRRYSCPFCSLTEADVRENNSVDGREEALEKVAGNQTECMLKEAGTTRLTAGILHKAQGQPVPRAGPETDSLHVRAWEKGKNRWNETLPSEGQHAPLLPRISSEKKRSISSALNFLLDKRWVACCLYKDLILLKTVSQVSAGGVLLTNLEEELHEWVAGFFEKHPHILHSAKYMRLGFEKLSKRREKLRSGQFATPPLLVEGEQRRKQQNQQLVHREHLWKGHERGQQESRPQQRELRPQPAGQQRHPHQQEENVNHQHSQRPEQLQTQLQLPRDTEHWEHISTASLHQSHQNATDRNRQERRESVAVSCDETSASSSTVAVHFHPSVHYRCFNKTAQKSGGPRDPHVRKSDAVSASTAEQVTGPKEPGQKHLPREVTGTAAASGSPYAGNEVFLDLEDGDGQLRLFVNTEDGRFYCLNLHRRCLEAAWPEVSYPEESRQPFALSEGCN